MGAASELGSYLVKAMLVPLIKHHSRKYSSWHYKLGQISCEIVSVGPFARATSFSWGSTSESKEAVPILASHAQVNEYLWKAYSVTMSLAVESDVS